MGTDAWCLVGLGFTNSYIFDESHVCAMAVDEKGARDSKAPVADCNSQMERTNGVCVAHREHSSRMRTNIHNNCWGLHTETPHVAGGGEGVASKGSDGRGATCVASGLDHATLLLWVVCDTWRPVCFWCPQEATLISKKHRHALVNTYFSDAFLAQGQNRAPTRGGGGVVHRTFVCGWTCVCVPACAWACLGVPGHVRVCATLNAHSLWWLCCAT